MVYMCGKPRSGSSRMPKAFVMINVRVGKDGEVVEALKRMQYVTAVYEVYAVYDIVAEIETETMDQLGETVNTKIRKLENVLSTQTMTVSG